MREHSEYRVAVNGVELHVYDWPGERGTVLLAHATGFHARCWDAIVEQLPEFRCISVDMRGHGRSSKPEPPDPYLWANYAADIEAFAGHLDLRGAIGVGHSKGGYAVARAAGRRPGTFAALLLVDPVIMPRERYATQYSTGEHFAARRRNEWQSPDEMYERFANRPPFDSWDRRVLRDYCDYGLLPAEGGGYVLACPPAIEAATYGGSMGGDPYPDIAKVTVPVRVLRAKQRTEADPLMTMSASPTAPDLASQFTQGEDVYMPERSHFIAMEAPGLVADEIRALADRVLPTTAGS